MTRDLQICLSFRSFGSRLVLSGKCPSKAELPSQGAKPALRIYITDHQAAGFPHTPIGLFGGKVDGKKISVPYLSFSTDPHPWLLRSSILVIFTWASIARLSYPGSKSRQIWCRSWGSLQLSGPLTPIRTSPERRLDRPSGCRRPRHRRRRQHRWCPSSPPHIRR